MKKIKNDITVKSIKVLTYLRMTDAIPKGKWDSPIHHTQYAAIKNLAKRSLDYSRSCFRLKSLDKFTSISGYLMLLMI